MHGRFAAPGWLLPFAFALSTVVLLGSVTPAVAGEFLLKAGDLQVPAGTVVRGEAISLGGTLYVDGTVEGDAVAVGGNVEVSGHVEGSVRAVGGNVTLRSTAVVDGEASAMGGTVYREPGASVGGTQIQPPPLPPLPPLPAPGPWPRPFPHPVPDESGPWGWLVPLFVLKWLLWTFYLLVLASFVASAWLVAVLLPGATERFARTIERDPLAAFGVGLLGWPITLMLMLLLALSVVGIPLALLVPLALLIALQFGTTAVALLVGRRIRRASIAQEVVVGAVILAIVFSIPHLGWLAILVVSTWGLGGVLLAILEARRSRQIPPAAPPGSPQT